MAEVRGNSGDCDCKVTIGSKSGPGGERLVNEYITELEITEAIDVPTIMATILIDDSGDFFTSITGGELWSISLNQKGRKSITYTLQSYKISDFVKSEKRSKYVVHLASPEFLRNELSNLFGIFPEPKQKEMTSTEYCYYLLKKKKIKTLGGTITSKKVYVPDHTKEKMRWVSPNWRVFNAVNWLLEKSIRPTNSKPKQSGYIFYENALGFHVTSIDQMITDLKSQSSKFQDGSDNGPRPKPPMYKYTYGQKDVANNSKADNQYKIEKLTFPRSYSILDRIRHGTWAGYTQAFDPLEISKGTSNDKSKDIPVEAQPYRIDDLWGKMSHIESEKPYKGAPDWAWNTPRRQRLKVIMSGTFGPAGGSGNNSAAINKKQPAGGAKYGDIVDAVSYSLLRVKSLMYQQLRIDVTGNLDLFAGHGITLSIPKNLPNAPSNTKIPEDSRWSGKWMIAGLTHKYRSGSLNTGCLLCRDSSKA
jgi:hypothetical protein